MKTEDILAWQNGNLFNDAQVDDWAEVAQEAVENGYANSVLDYIGIQKYLKEKKKKRN